MKPLQKMGRLKQKMSDRVSALRAEDHLESLRTRFTQSFRDWLTLVIIPQKATRVVRVKIPQVLFFVLAGVVVALALVGANTLLDNLYFSDKVSDYRKLQNDFLHNQLAVQKVANQMDMLKEQINRMREMDYKLRVISDLEGDRNSASGYGIGGTMDQTESGATKLDLNHADLLTVLDRDLSHLREMADYQEESFNNLKAYLSDKKDLLDRTPHRWPVRGFLSSTFGYRFDPFTGMQKMHEGVDVVARRGTVVTAPADGIVTYSGEDPTFGHMLIIDHGYGIITRYGHNDVVLVREGQRVKRGDPVSHVGSSGKSTGPHLHYEIRIHDKAVNPSSYMMD